MTPAVFLGQNYFKFPILFFKVRKQVDILPDEYDQCELCKLRSGAHSPLNGGADGAMVLGLCSLFP